MAKIVYNTTTGVIAAAFADSQTVGTLPAGFAVFTEATALTAMPGLVVDLGGPSTEEIDYVRFTGPTEQVVDTVDTHGVQKVDGPTDLDLANPSDNELVFMQLGDINRNPATTQKGFLAEQDDQLLNGAATFKLASGSVAGNEYLHVKPVGLQIAKNNLTYN